MVRKAIVTSVAVLASVIFILIYFTISSTVAASESRDREKVVICVCVEEGDTLWSLATKYYTSDYKDIPEFVHAIKACNGISDQIKIGQSLLIPYYRSLP